MSLDAKSHHRITSEALHSQSNQFCFEIVTTFTAVMFNKCPVNSIFAGFRNHRRIFIMWIFFGNTIVEKFDTCFCD